VPIYFIIGTKWAARAIDMGTISVSAILGNMNEERPYAAKAKPLAARYHAFLDGETDSVMEEDRVDLSGEAQQQAGK